MFDCLKRITFSVHEVLYVVVFGNMQPGPTAPHVQAIITTPLVVVSRDIYIYIFKYTLYMAHQYLIHYIYFIYTTVEAASRTLRKYRSPRHNGFRRQDE